MTPTPAMQKCCGQPPASVFLAFSGPARLCAHWGYGWPFVPGSSSTQLHGGQGKLIGPTVYMGGHLVPHQRPFCEGHSGSPLRSRLRGQGLRRPQFSDRRGHHGSRKWHSRFSYQNSGPVGEQCIHTVRPDFTRSTAQHSKNYVIVG